MHPINEKRDRLGVYANLVNELRGDKDSRRHIKYLRMSPENFDYILEAIRPLITMLDTDMREAIKGGGWESICQCLNMYVWLIFYPYYYIYL